MSNGIQRWREEGLVCERSALAFFHGRAEPDSQRRWRSVAQEADNTVKQIAATEKPAKDLGVHTVQVFSAELDRVRDAGEGEVVSGVRMPEDLIDLRFQEERMPETERRRKANSGVRNAGRINCDARPIFPRVGEVCFVQFG